VGAGGCDVVAFGGTLEGRDGPVGDEAGGGAGDVDVVDFGDLDWEGSAGCGGDMLARTGSGVGEERIGDGGADRMVGRERIAGAGEWHGAG
jgi:hypothetical protein